jgi:O-antigen ligase/Tfp pilus assembly protein PilF
MKNTPHISIGRNPGLIFCIGLAVVLLSLTVSVPPIWNTFIHLWRVEFVASLFLAFVLVVALYRSKVDNFHLRIPVIEAKLLILPIVAFIFWSALSIAWAPSWKSVLHHTLIWCEYLIFYLVVRQLLAEPGNYRKLLNTVTLCLAFFSVLAVFSYATLLVFGSTNSIGIVYAKYGEQVNTVLPLFMVSVLRLNGRRFFIALSVFLALWLLIFCSLSRTNLILFAVGMTAMTGAALVLKQFRVYRRKILVTVAAAILVLIPLHAFSLLSPMPNVPFVSRVGDSAGIDSSNNFRKLMLLIGFEMVKTHPVVGVGADNFGFEANKYRKLLGANSPDNLYLSEAEDGIPERAHNEYVQITAELGIVGAAIFLWFIASIALMGYLAIKQRSKMSPYLLASFFGLALFLASSMVTSYSFRLIQNGFVFFFVLAVAASRSFKAVNIEQGSNVSFLGPGRLKFAVSTGVCLSLLLTAYCVVRVTSVAITENANATARLDEAIPQYRLAMRIDNENPEAPYFLGLRSIEQGHPADAVPYLQDSVRIGKARSSDLSFLATAQELSGDNMGAEQTFEQAVLLYPRSPFVLTRYAALLQKNGRAEQASEILTRARMIDQKQANSWWAMITVSPQAAADLANRRPDYLQLMDLKPQDSMYAVKAEREILHPEEKLALTKLWDKVGSQ